MKRIAMLYGYGQLANGELDAQSIGRCKKALELYNDEKIDKVCITVGVRKNGRSMGRKMKEWLTSHGGLTNVDIILSPRGLNTAGETMVCWAILGDPQEQAKVTITAISSWYHLPRIWLLWLWRGRMVRLAASYEGIHLKDILIEPLKLLNSTLRPRSSAKYRINEDNP